MENKQIDAIFSLLKGGNFEFIESLIEISFISKNVFVSAICKYCKDSIYNVLNTSWVLDIIEKYFGFDDDKIIFDLLITRLTIFSQKTDESLFKKLVDMGAQIKCIKESYIVELPSDLFFYYVANNEVNISSYMAALVFRNMSGCGDVRDWIFEQWEISNVKYDLIFFLNIARASFFCKSKKYLSRTMLKLCNYPDFHIIILYILQCCTYRDDTSDLIIYISNCEYRDELMFFRLFSTMRGTQIHVDDEVIKFVSFINTNDGAKKIKYDIENTTIEKYDNMLSQITLLMNMYVDN